MSSFPSVSGTGKGLCTEQFKKLQSMYPDMKHMSYQQLAQFTNPNLFVGSGEKKKREEKKTVPPSPADENKLFKRSSYHVAIAYHIYLKNLKAKGNVIENEIDPTYHAKKLKEGRPN